MAKRPRGRATTVWLADITTSVQVGGVAAAVWERSLVPVLVQWAVPLLLAPVVVEQGELRVR